MTRGALNQESSAERSVIVTGAGRGLGAEIAAYAAESGWIVGVLDLDGDLARETAAGIGIRAVPLVADTTDSNQVEAALDGFATNVGIPSPDGLVCNAGIVRFGPLLDLTEDDWKAVVDVNLTGTFLCARAVARRAISSDRAASIVNVTSMNGVAPGPNAGAYGATKAAVARLSQQMALEWSPAGVRVNALAPGLIDGGMSEQIYADPDIRERRSRSVPLGRLGTATDVAKAAMFLLGDDAAYVNGTELLVDGGVTMSVISTLPRPQSVDNVGTSAGTQAPIVKADATTTAAHPTGDPQHPGEPGTT